MTPAFTLRSRLPSPQDTASFAAALAPRLKPGDTVLLHGDLGAGKSHFARALIRARLGDAAAEVPSPTFTLVQTYDAPDVAIWHADLYRLSGPDDVHEIGLSDAFETAVCLVEWPDRLADEAPRDALNLMLEVDENDTRILTLSGPERWRPIVEDLVEHTHA